ncbi:MAG TPA: DUF2865 domain-containing protein [Hyphomicrobiales bacterium]|nr:DUF2865 domain-containing protein [Rhodobiaceae bacterium]HXK53141.1 DUF2865 domain-containing protein [Hyphomicrobiales bacterium]
MAMAKYKKWFGPARSGAALLLLAGAAVLSGGAAAQQQNARCYLLEQELASYDRAVIGTNPELDRLDDALGRQQDALNRTESHARQIGCFKTGFLFFRPRRPEECGQLESSIDQMRRNLAQLSARRDQIAGPTRNDDPGKQRILQLLAENRCGPQYSRFATFNRTPSIFGSWSEEDSGPGERGIGTDFGRRMLGNVPSYRTLCVRSCDGYYFPISFATLPERFQTDAEQCRALCPSAVVELYVHENPGGTPEQMVSLNGRPYSSIPTAFRYRKEYVKGCSCNPFTLKLEEEEERRAALEAKTVPAPGEQPAGETPAPAPGAAGQSGNAAPESGSGATGSQSEAAPAQQTATGIPATAGEGSGQAAAANPAAAGGTGSTGGTGGNATFVPGSGGQVNVFRPSADSGQFAPRFQARSGDSSPNVIRVGPSAPEGGPRFSTSR